MYSPIKDGVGKAERLVEYIEVKPPDDLANLVDCFWELKTITSLSNDFYLHAIPDACVDIMFNELDSSIAGITALRTRYEVLNLGRNFHYVGIQFLPGVWQGKRDEISDQYIDAAYTGSLPLINTNRKMMGLNFNDKQAVMAKLVRDLTIKKLVMVSDVTAKILANLDTIYTVSDMAEITSISPRQLQRTLKQATGFAPHDFLKVLRLQQAVKQGYLTLYTDQSHFIHSFRAITGYTPAQYFSKFDV